MRPQVLHGAMLQCPTMRSLHRIAALLALTHMLVSCAGSPTPEQREAIMYRHKLIQLAPKMDVILSNEFRATEELKQFLGQPVVGNVSGDTAKIQVFVDRFNMLSRERTSLLKEVSSQLRTPLPLFVQKNLMAVMDEQNRQIGVWLILLSGLKNNISAKSSNAGSVNQPSAASALEIGPPPPVMDEVRLLRTMVEPSTEMQNRLLAAAEELRVELRLPQDAM
jgi:hypothetical protein